MSNIKRYIAEGLGFIVGSGVFLVIFGTLFTGAENLLIYFAPQQCHEYTPYSEVFVATASVCGFFFLCFFVFNPILIGIKKVFKVTEKISYKDEYTTTPNKVAKWTEENPIIFLALLAIIVLTGTLICFWEVFKFYYCIS